jgi:hypothetical protein
MADGTFRVAGTLLSVSAPIIHHGCVFRTLGVPNSAVKGVRSIQRLSILYEIYVNNTKLFPKLSVIRFHTKI